MKFTLNSSGVKTILILLLVIIGLGSFIYTQILVSQLRKKERLSVQLWAKAIEYNGSPQNQSIRKELQDITKEIADTPQVPQAKKVRWVDVIDRSEADLANAAVDFVTNELIIKNRFEIPSVLTDSSRNVLNTRNIKQKKVDESTLKHLAEMNQPIKIMIGDGAKRQKQYVFYGESSTITLLRYLPYLQFSLLAVFLTLAYYSWSSVRRNEQSSLWVGMAREAAHQLGTPISSLMGWIALLKDNLDDEQNLNITHELSMDVKRLQKVADRFNKIGSEPELKTSRLEPSLREVIRYMEMRKPRVGKKIRFTDHIETETKLRLNPDLFQWAIENLIKNSLDALENNKSNPEISIFTKKLEDQLIIEISDTGKGIEKKYQKEIFRPGYSTKKRGWGLGLSLTRRIIEEYHGGKITVASSSPGKGTTFRIELPLMHLEDATPAM